MEFHVRAARLGMAHRVLRVRRHVAPAPVDHRTTVSNAPRVPGKNGSYVTIEANGVCLGTNGMIANNNKKMCDSENHLFFINLARSLSSHFFSLACGAKCTTCEIPNFSDVSTMNQLKCTGCLPGFFLVNGQCMHNCPSGTLQSQNSATCEGTLSAVFAFNNDPNKLYNWLF